MGVTLINKCVQEKNLDIKYPQLKMFRNKRQRDSARAKINELIKNVVHYYIKEEIGEEDDKSISIGYEIKLNRNSLLSIVFEICSFIKGQNEIFTTTRSLTLDIKSGGLLRFKDLFIENSYYDYIINKIIADDIEINQTPFIQEFFNKDRNKLFYLTEKYLVIYIPLYKDTNYAKVYCIPEYFISYDKIKGFLNPKYSIIKLNKN
jgi:hypothetical protein